MYGDAEKRGVAGVWEHTEWIEIPFSLRSSRVFAVNGCVTMAVVGDKLALCYAVPEHRCDLRRRGSVGQISGGSRFDIWRYA